MSQPAKILYYRDGLLLEGMWVQDGVRHCEDGPQRTSYYDNGNISSRCWVRHGQLHRTDGPALQYFFEDGKLHFECWRQYHKLYRDDGGPCEISYSYTFQGFEGFEECSEKWYKASMHCRWFNEKGQHSRLDGPALITYDIEGGYIKHVEYWIDGMLFRPDGGPTVVFYNPDGTPHEDHWVINGLRGIELHREDGPAVIEYHHEAPE